MNEEELKQYIIAKRNPISNCIDLSKYFIGRHTVLPVYLTSQFEREFNSKMCQLEKLKELIIKLKNQPTVYLTKYMDEFGFVETKTLNELIEELEKSDGQWN